MVVVPCGITVNLSDQEKNEVHDKCYDYKKLLESNEVRAHVDSRPNYSPGWKFNHWELKVSR